MSSLVLRSLSILLGLFFIFIGIMKISPHLSKDLHRDLVSVRHLFWLILATKPSPSCVKHFMPKTSFGI
ncbi:AGAP007501-PA-like protein [Anopheles sinensis]|uniref:AGAP007501-PA-like protein n=1 Tax=Anopheles sinensis TaxID=74873 RepID=A0A084WNC4_ANOSI|nr:AGAP007501-PA-like protein [Anopheles sinensis]